MKYEAKLIDKTTNETIFTLNGETVNDDLSINIPNNYKIPRCYGIKNIEGNEEIYNQLLNHIGKTLRMESDEINGLFKISMDQDEIVLKEVFK